VVLESPRFGPRARAARLAPAWRFDPGDQQHCAGATPGGPGLPNARKLFFVQRFRSSPSPMKHYDFTARFHALYNQAVARYAGGHREAGTMFSADEAAFLRDNGLTVQHLYDYAEDHNNYSGEPGADIALSIELVRRDYFLNVQHSRASATILAEPSLPAKTETVRGIEWLPRIIPKARAKLRGELPATLMYCCGGDRKFFKQHDILPSEFLALIWRSELNNAAIIDWVVKRSSGK
jgi:hypothetical protein